MRGAFLQGHVRPLGSSLSRMLRAACVWGTARAPCCSRAPVAVGSWPRCSRTSLPGAFLPGRTRHRGRAPSASTRVAQGPAGTRAVTRCRPPPSSGEGASPHLERPPGCWPHAFPCLVGFRVCPATPESRGSGRGLGGPALSGFLPSDQRPQEQLLPPAPPPCRAVPAAHTGPAVRPRGGGPESQVALHGLICMCPVLNRLVCICTDVRCKTRC